MERDDDIGTLYDEADEQAFDYLYRERMTREALDRCAKAGASIEDLKTLAREAGVTNWKPKEQRCN